MEYKTNRVKMNPMIPIEQINPVPAMARQDHHRFHRLK